MKILINCSNLLHGGALQVANSLIRDLVNFPEHSYYIVVTQEVEEQLGNLSSFPDNFHFASYQLRYHWYNGFTLRDCFLDNYVEQHQIDMVYSVFGPCCWRPRVPHICGYAKPQYIYKESPFFKQLRWQERLKLTVKEIIHMNWFRSGCDGLVSESKDVSERLKQRLLGKRVFTVSNNYNQIFDEEELQQELHLPSFEGCTLLTITAYYPHKNLSIYPGVVRYLRSTYPSFQFRFVLTQPESLLDSLGVSPSERKYFLCIGKININQCPSLYRQCDFMFLPTLLECFSASYPEAMRMRKPILTSNLSFAHGLCGSAAYYFEPTSPASIGDAIYHLATHSGLQKRLVDSGSEQLKQYDCFRDRTKKYLNIIELFAEESVNK